MVRELWSVLTRLKVKVMINYTCSSYAKLYTKNRILSAHSEVWHLITEAAEETSQEVIGDVRAEAHASRHLVSVQLPVVVGPRARPLQHQQQQH